MVVIALPLHLHAKVAIEAMEAGKHVLCEKLMGWNIRQCKAMIRKADETGKLLSIGHQRHYSMLYAHANDVVHSGVLGDIKHIRALWHRNNVRPNTDPRTKVLSFRGKTAAPSKATFGKSATRRWRNSCAGAFTCAPAAA